MKIFLCFIASTLFTSFFVEGMFEGKFEELRTEWGQGSTPMPFYSEEVEEVAAGNASDLFEALRDEYRPEPKIDSVFSEEFENAFALFSLVNGFQLDEFEAIARFIENTKLKLEENITLKLLNDGKPVRIIDAVGYCVVGGVSAVKYTNNYIVLAYFEFGYADEYMKFVKNDGRLPLYNIVVEKLANNFANTEEIICDDRLDDFTSSVRSVDNHLVLLIQTNILTKDFHARDLLQKFCKELLEQQVLQKLMASDSIHSHFPTHKTLDSLLKSAVDGGMSISYRSLPKPVLMEIGGETSFAYKFCLCLRFKML